MILCKKCNGVGKYQSMGCVFVKCYDCGGEGAKEVPVKVKAKKKKRDEKEERK